MTDPHAEPDGPSTVLEPIVDYESLREGGDVPYHEETEVVDEATVDQVAELPDLAGIGITNTDGDLLLRRLTDTCSWKIPVATVAPAEDFATAITDHVAETIGFSLELDGIVGVWDVRLQTAAEDQSARRGFVIFDGSTVSGKYDLDAATPDGDAIEAGGWFDRLPEDADLVPGTEQLLD